MLLDQSGRMFHANVAAETMLRSQDGITVSSGMVLEAAMPEDERHLRAAIAQALAVAGGSTDSFRLALSLQRRSGLPPLLALFTPLPVSSSLMLKMADRACLLVKVIDPVDSVKGGADALREAYGLTAAQARVAELIATGLSAPEIAIALGVSASTVRTHLAACFDKTGLRSQVTLARLVGTIGRAAGSVSGLGTDQPLGRA
jgi:DNA-binding CsgD family transcriptional regulator